MNKRYTLVERLPTFDEYRDLCTSVNWQHAINFDAAPCSLENSLYGVVVLLDQVAVGMGRLVGDGVMYFYVQDVAIHPQHQRQGIGRQIMSALLDFIQRTAHGPVFVGLFSTAEAQRLYEAFGFDARRDLTGMFQVVVGKMRKPEA
jgi:ribosomal protein S18 acetylase RimI-like enzyme